MQQDSKPETQMEEPQEKRIMSRRNKMLLAALLFLAPNFLGFCAFTLFPVVASLAGSFTTWNLRPTVDLQFVGFANFIELFTDRYFYFYLYNTIYLMLALPVSIAGSLFFAVFLSQRFDFKGAGARYRLTAAAAVITIFVTFILILLGFPNTSFVIFALGFLSALGIRFGSITYRTAFYLPHFTAGAATILLWTQLYNPNFGLINQLIEVIYGTLGIQASAPGWLTSTRTLLGFLPLPEYFNNSGFGLGAREAMMIMGIWAAIGGNNMILYLAGLANIPPELYEAADIDGANGWQRFRFITLPQLAPTTFFIVIMSVIGGLQGGFEQAMLMTRGGPAGTTTTLSYYIYIHGFERLDLAYGAAVAWALFVLIFGLTLLYWRHGNRRMAD